MVAEVGVESSDYREREVKEVSVEVGDESSDYREREVKEVECGLGGQFFFFFFEVGAGRGRVSRGIGLRMTHYLTPNIGEGNRESVTPAKCGGRNRKWTRTAPRPGE
jgi:hypothetical protein